MWLLLIAVSSICRDNTYHDVSELARRLSCVREEDRDTRDEDGHLSPELSSRVVSASALVEQSTNTELDSYNVSASGFEQEARRVSARDEDGQISDGRLSREVSTAGVTEQGSKASVRFDQSAELQTSMKKSLKATVGGSGSGSATPPLKGKRSASKSRRLSSSSAVQPEDLNSSIRSELSRADSSNPSSGRSNPGAGRGKARSGLSGLASAKRAIKSTYKEAKQNEREKDTKRALNKEDSGLYDRSVLSR